MRIPFSECKHRGLYLLASRNLRCGVFDKEYGYFIGIREKFGRRYLDIEIHFENLGSAVPKQYLEQCPTENIRSENFVDGSDNVELLSWLEMKESELDNPTKE